jgi:hypothetical protein
MCWKPELKKYAKQPLACPGSDLPNDSQPLTGISGLMETINAVSGDATKRAKFSKVFCPMTYTSKKLLKENKTRRRLAAGDSCTEKPLPSNS